MTRLAASWLFWYPDERLPERVPDIRRVVADLPKRTREPLEAFLGWFGQQDRWSWLREYVTTFDVRRKACPYLTYWTHGDTPQPRHGDPALQAGLPGCWIRRR